MLSDDGWIREQAVERHDGRDARERRQEGEEGDATSRGEDPILRDGPEDTLKNVSSIQRAESPLAHPRNGHGPAHAPFLVPP